MSADIVVGGSDGRSVLGLVTDDWAAAEVWLATLKARNPPVSPRTLSSYRSEMDRLKWYCEKFRVVEPSRWTLQDVLAYLDFLRTRASQHICRRRLPQHDSAWTPFRKPLGPTSVSHAQKVLHALFVFWFQTGHVKQNPMAGLGGGAQRAAPTRHAVPPDLIDTVIGLMDKRDYVTLVARLTYARNRFLIQLIEGVGLRASEVVLANMGDFELMSDPRTMKTYWSLLVRHGKGGYVDRVPVPYGLIEQLGAYRQAFGLPPAPQPGEATALVLSGRTRRSDNGVRPSVRGRRGALQWGEVRRRATLWDIVKKEFAECAEYLDGLGNTADAELLRRASTHWLRHTFGKTQLLAGRDVRFVQKLLRQRDIRSTMIYTELDFFDMARGLEPGTVEVPERSTS